MKKFLAIPVVVFLLLLGIQSQALSSGYSMTVLAMDEMADAVVVMKFDSATFTQAQVNEFTQAAKEFAAAQPDIHVFSHQELGDPDALRVFLSDYYDFFEIVFVNIGAGPSRMPGLGPNIWIDVTYDNLGMYVASLGFPEEFMDMIDEFEF